MASSNILSSIRSIAASGSCAQRAQKTQIPRLHQGRPMRRMKRLLGR
jgi:hypothetical protein